MKSGTIDPSEEIRILRRMRRAAGGGPGGPGGGGGDGPDGNGGLRPEADLTEPMDEYPEKSTVITWFLLIIVLMTFGGLIGAYIVVSTNNALEWRPFSLPAAVWISTVLIVWSSVTYYLAEAAVRRGSVNAARRYFVITSAIGGMFIASQMIAWLALYQRGMFVQGHPYAGFFYVLTAVHAIHVVGGIVALGIVTLRLWNETSDRKEIGYRKNLARSVGWYWHFMGGIWIVLFILLGYWK